MGDSRLSKKVFLWDKQLNESGLVNTWYSEITDILQRNGLPNVHRQGLFPLQDTIKHLKHSLLLKDQLKWKSKCLPLPKLRTFIKFKDFSSDSPHIYKPLSFMQRKSLSKF